MTFDEWWVSYWMKPQRNWMPEYYVDVAKAAYEEGNVDEHQRWLGSLSQPLLIAYLNNLKI